MLKKLIWAVNRDGIPLDQKDWMKNKTYKSLVEKKGYQYDEI